MDAALGAEGVDDTANSPGKTPRSQIGGAKSGAVPEEMCPELAKIISAWPKLSEATRRALLGLIE
jgi:hypothetical protein